MTGCDRGQRTGKLLFHYGNCGEIAVFDMRGPGRARRVVELGFVARIVLQTAFKVTRQTENWIFSVRSDVGQHWCKALCENKTNPRTRMPLPVVAPLSTFTLPFCRTLLGSMPPPNSIGQSHERRPKKQVNIPQAHRPTELNHVKDLYKRLCLKSTLLVANSSPCESTCV